MRFLSLFRIIFGLVPVLRYNSSENNVAHYERISKASSFKSAFYLLDKNRDDFINSTELGIVMTNIGLNVTYDELDQMIHEVDIEENGKVSYYEIMYMLDIDKIIEARDIQEVFNLFDGDNDRMISKSEVLHVMTLLQGKVALNYVVNGVFKDADKDGDELIDYDEFSQFFKHIFNTFSG
ncbi:Cam.2 family protein [Megaselia abdita]